MSGETSADISSLLAGLKAADARVVKAAIRAVDQFGEHVIGDAQQLCPVDTGALLASGTTLPAEFSGGSIDKTIGFNTSYAAAVHERLDAKHPVGQAKYLSTAMAQNAPKFVPFVESRVAAATEGSGGA